MRQHLKKETHARFWQTLHCPEVCKITAPLVNIREPLEYHERRTQQDTHFI